jgi:putative transferase (TIGR04331 family)
MSKKYSLVCTALKNTFPKKKNDPILFLGEWCLDYQTSEYYKNKHNVVCDYHWNNVKKFEKDADYLEVVYEFYLKIFSNFLNKYHSVNHSIRYWRILIGPWLKQFINLLFDRWQMINFVEKKYSIKNKIILNIKNQSIIHDDIQIFHEEIQNDYFNEVIYSDIIENFSTINKKKINKLINNNLNKNKLLFANKILYSVIKFYHLLVSFIFSNKYILIFSFLSLKSIIYFNFYLKQFPFFFTRNRSVQNFDTVDIDWNTRLSALTVFSGSKFHKILNYMLIKYIPKSYLENFNKNDDCIEYKFLKNKKKVFIVGDIVTFDSYKKFIADSIEKNNSKLYLLQHGGCYFFAKKNYAQKHELKICDRYLSYGKYKNRKVVSFTNARVLGKKLSINKNKSNILFIQLNISKYFFSEILSSTFSSRFIEYFNNQVIFVKNLKIKLRKELIIRYASNTYHWQQDLRWKNYFPNIKINHGEKSLFKVLQDVKICVVSYNGTSMLETLLLNVPTVIFWNLEIENLDKKGNYFINILKSAGIFHGSAEAASNKINEIYDNVGEWWNSHKVQDARKRFCDQYSAGGDYKNYKNLSYLIK